MTEYAWIDLGDGRSVYRAVRPSSESKRGAVPLPGVVTDSMPALQHVDGKYYDSKSAFRRVTKAHGYIEVGNDPARLRHAPAPRKPDPKEIRETIEKAAARVRRGERPKHTPSEGIA